MREPSERTVNHQRPDPTTPSAPTALPVRTLYACGHFGNFYEVALPNEMTEVLSEARWWGFNRYLDWFNGMDLYDPYRKDHRLYNMPEAMWERKLKNFAIAQRLGLELSLYVTPNHVFSTQVTPDNGASRSRQIFGQLVCPSKPGVVELIIENYRNLFRDMAGRGLRLRSLEGAAYDYGGCACEQCRPWIVTFGRLYQAIASEARGIFGSNLEINLNGWWWTEEEHRQFADWADREAPGLFHALAFHLPYGQTRHEFRQLPLGTRERAFVHIAYGMTRRDTYGHYGPTIAPCRIEQTIGHLLDSGAEGFVAYSEGIYDDVNKALAAGLGSGRFGDADEVLTEYARRYLGEDAQGWTHLMGLLADPFGMDLAQARALIDRLLPTARASWRVAQLQERLNMAEANATAGVAHGRDGEAGAWDDQRLRAAERFWAAKERLYRQIWRLGLSRHIFRFEGSPPSWQAEYEQAIGQRSEPQEVTVPAQA